MSEERYLTFALGKGRLAKRHWNFSSRSVLPATK